MIIFVGCNPSRLNEDPNVAFVGSRSHPILKGWIDQLGIAEYEMINVSSKVGKILQSDIDYESLQKNASNKTVIALGSVASKALSKLGISHFKLPHPSPKNRQLNDKQYIMDRLAQCKEWI